MGTGLFGVEVEVGGAGVLVPSNFTRFAAAQAG